MKDERERKVGTRQKQEERMGVPPGIVLTKHHCHFYNHAFDSQTIIQYITFSSSGFIVERVNVKETTVRYLGIPCSNM